MWLEILPTQIIPNCSETDWLKAGNVLCYKSCCLEAVAEIHVYQLNMVVLLTQCHSRPSTLYGMFFCKCFHRDPILFRQSPLNATFWSNTASSIPTAHRHWFLESHAITNICAIKTNVFVAFQIIFLFDKGLYRPHITLGVCDIIDIPVNHITHRKQYVLWYDAPVSIFTWYFSGL